MKSADQTGVFASPDAAHTQRSSRLTCPMYVARFATTATGTCSTAPADARLTAAVTRGAVLEHDDAVGARALGAATHGTEIVRVGHLVETDDEGALPRHELIRVRVAVRLAERDDTLMLSCSRGIVEPAFPRNLQADALHLAKPCFRGKRTLGRQQLEDLALARAHDLAHGPAPVDQVLGDGHGLRTSR